MQNSTITLFVILGGQRQKAEARAKFRSPLLPASIQTWAPLLLQKWLCLPGDQSQRTKSQLSKRNISKAPFAPQRNTLSTSFTSLDTNTAVSLILYLVKFQNIFISPYNNNTRLAPG